MYEHLKIEGNPLEATETQALCCANECVSYPTELREVDEISDATKSASTY